MVFRSCGPEMNLARRFYHSGETSDLAFTVQHLEARHPDAPILLAGASLGGNVLLKYLGERGKDVSPRIVAAAAVSVPFDLARSSRHIYRGFARVYQRHFIRSLRRKAVVKLERFPDLVGRERMDTARTMFDFDDAFTAPLHGFGGASDYYRQSSSRRWLSNISVKTLLLSAADDPFLPEQVLDEVREVALKNAALELEVTPRGGHVGFVAGMTPFNPFYYLEQRVADFLAAQINFKQHS